MENNNTLIDDMKKTATKTEKVLKRTGTTGRLDMRFDVRALMENKAKIRITSNITDMTPAEAQQIGWAIYMLGKYGEEIELKEEHTLVDDEDFFAD